MSKTQISYSDEFKQQIVNLHKSGKPVTELAREYGLSRSSVYTWIKYASSSGSFKEADNRSEQEKELIELRKINKKLLMENDILKQAALIMGRK